MDSYKVRSTEHVDLEFYPAGLGSRLIAAGIDTCIIGVTIAIFLVILQLFGVFAEPLWILISFVILWGYHFFWEAFLKGRSPGKMALKLQIIDESGRLPTTRQALIRTLFRAVDSLPAFGIVAGACILKSKLSQRIGDKMAGTLVVYARPLSLQGHEALYVGKIRRGGAKFKLTLPLGAISPQLHTLMHAFIQRRETLSSQKRAHLAESIAKQLLPVSGWDPQKVQEPHQCEALIEWAMLQLKSEEEEEVQNQQWNHFVELLNQIQKNLKSLKASLLEELLVHYRQISSDLSRARSFGADSNTVAYLNALAIRAYQILHPPDAAQGRSIRSVIALFPQTVRKQAKAVALSSAILILSAAISYFAVQESPQVGFDLVSENFYDFQPKSDSHMHEIPPLMRPVVSSAIIANNIQVAIVGFALGITGGLGTVYVLVSNGVHVGAVLGWMVQHGQGPAIIGWILPHGFTEMLAIVLSCAAGLTIGGALLIPQQKPRKLALMDAGKEGMIIIVGVLAMLGIAGLIEGFVSPSSIDYPARVAILAVSVVFWGWFFIFVPAPMPLPVPEKRR